MVQFDDVSNYRRKETKRDPRKTANIFKTLQLTGQHQDITDKRIIRHDLTALTNYIFIARVVLEAQHIDSQMRVKLIRACRDHGNLTNQEEPGPFRIIRINSFKKGGAQVQLSPETALQSGTTSNIFGHAEK